jgi:hypothetical protein
MNKNIIPVATILLAVLFRMLPHPPNFTPIAAIAIFGGIYFPKKHAFVVPLLGLGVSDLFLGFHSTIPFVYGSFFITILIGLWLKSHKNAGFILGGTLLSSVLFFIITNFGVWLTGSMYSKDLTGLLESYILAIPFFRNTILGDIIYTGVFVGGYELLNKLAPKFKLRLVE